MPASLTSDFADKIIFFVDELRKHAHRQPDFTNPSGAWYRRAWSVVGGHPGISSAVHERSAWTGDGQQRYQNPGILGRTGSQEVGQPDYHFLDNDLKMVMTRLAKGELLINHAVYRQPVKVVFPKPAYRQDQA